MEIKQALRLLRARWLTILLAVLVGTGASGLYSYFFIDPVYEASADLILTSEVQNGGTAYSVLMAGGMLIQTYRSILQTSGLIQGVVRAHPEWNLSPAGLLSRVSTETTGTQILSVVVRDSSYGRARQIANALAEALVREIPRIMKLNNLSVLNPAPELADPVPVRPDPAMNAAIGFLVSLLASAAAILFRESVRDDLRTSHEVENAGVAVLGVLPKVKRTERHALLRSAAQDQKGDRLHAVMEP